MEQMVNGTESSFSIDCEGLAVGYSGKPLCKEFDLEINNGDYICIVGENGAGKSTFIKTLIGLIPAMSRCAAILSGATSDTCRSSVKLRRISPLPYGRWCYPAASTDWASDLFMESGSESLPLLLSESLTSRILRMTAFANFPAGSGSACSWHAPSPRPQRSWFWTSR